MDNKLVIPKDMRAELKNSVHFGHPGRNAMLERVKDSWWPQIYPENCVVTEFCADCISEAEKREEEPLVIDGDRWSSVKLNTCPMGETWLFKETVRNTKLAPYYTFEMLTERNVTEEKPTTPKTKANKKGE